MDFKSIIVQSSSFMIDYHDRYFRSVSNTPNGEVSEETQFHYRQEDEVVWATYEGGAVRFGTLLARVDANGHLAYALPTSQQRRYLDDGRLPIHA